LKYEISISWILSPKYRHALAVVLCGAVWFKASPVSWSAPQVETFPQPWSSEMYVNGCHQGGFDVLTAVTRNSIILRYVMPYKSLPMFWRIMLLENIAKNVHDLSCYPEDGGSTFLLNVGELLPELTTPLFITVPMFIYDEILEPSPPNPIN
jgi:hypothetical protein